MPAVHQAMRRYGAATRQALAIVRCVGRDSRRERQARVTVMLLVIGLLVVLLFVLIFRINHAEHFAPQAYYRKKRGGAPVALGFESLGPRARKAPPSTECEEPGTRDA
jgi:hypothetical protein